MAAEDPSSLRFILRSRTRPEHEALDRSFADLMPPADIQPYHRFILMNHAAHGGVEDWLMESALIPFLPEWPGWSRRADLDADMAAMGLPTLGRPSFSLARGDLPEAIGVAYVLEGSRLGAVFIERAFRKGGVHDRWRGASFAYLAGSGDDRHFQTFAARMDGLSFSPAQTERCVGAARAAFEYFMAVRDIVGRLQEKVTEPV